MLSFPQYVRSGLRLLVRDMHLVTFWATSLPFPSDSVLARHDQKVGGFRRESGGINATDDPETREPATKPSVLCFFPPRT